MIESKGLPRALIVFKDFMLRILSGIVFIAFPDNLILRENQACKWILVRILIYIVEEKFLESEFMVIYTIVGLVFLANPFIT
ncbi:MAG: hypothetical protein ACFFAS_07075 [Promethearchaeota archaeon]